MQVKSLFPEAEVTRLLPNLLKSHYVNSLYDGPRVINSNGMIAKRFEQHADADKCEEEYDDELNQDFQCEEEQVDFDLSEYEKQADEMIENANKAAEKIIEEAKAEAEILKVNAIEEGKTSGYGEGYAKGLESAKAEEEKYLKLKEELEDDYQKQLDDIEPKLVSTIADVFEKVFNIQFGDRQDMILNVVKKSVNQIENSKEFLIKVPKENLQFILEHKEELQEKVGQYVKIEIISDNALSNNQCIIHTDSGVFDCSLDIQLDNLVRDIKTLSVSVSKPN